jgi:hypothetical protein
VINVITSPAGRDVVISPHLDAHAARTVCKNKGRTREIAALPIASLPLPSGQARGFGLGDAMTPIKAR